ncbi:hypothetical protein PENTCL1PPCAC_9554 [Pristionchus entomophagus]|uniref:Large ribosomal subunit protein bL36m n=1 Tax=Pristionchus entomophagus TaxID=358040 RepID=A0AAV5SWT2_9BILA|nr:hypothetical protein PENTCL1PPCAC_9554 [Pristionchus entomophagus]
MSGIVGRLLGTGSQLARSLLGAAQLPIKESAAGFKVKSRLKLRCRSCYFTRVDGRLHVECNEHPRHKAREIYNVKTLW